MNNEILILVLALTTFAIVVGVAFVMRMGVAKSKGDKARSAFTDTHGEAPRANRPGTEH